MKRKLLAAVALAALWASAFAQAQLYRWVDENGKVRYSDVPPPAAKGTKVQTVKPPAPASAAPRAAPDLKAEETAFQQRRIAKEEAEEAQARQRRVKCALARRAQQDMEGIRLYRRNPNGERSIVDDAERAAIERRVQKDIAENC